MERTVESNDSQPHVWNPPVLATNANTGVCRPGTNIGGLLQMQPYVYVTQPLLTCCCDTHVFHCPHCDTCQCGAATRPKKP